MNGDIILGGGLSGLVWAATHPGSIIIEPNELGGMANGDMGPFILHDTPSVDMFLHSIGLRPNKRIFKVGFLKWGQEDITNEASPIFRKKYYAETRYTTELDVPESVMNSDANTFSGYELTAEELINACIQAIYNNGGIYVKDTITSIKPNNAFSGQCIQTKRECIQINTSMRKIVSTIPYPIFNRLANIPWLDTLHDVSLGKAFWRIKGTRIDGYDLSDVENYDFVYCIHDTNPHSTECYYPNRLTPRDGYLLAEYTFPGEYNTDDIWESMIGKTLDDDTPRLGEPIVMPSVSVRQNLNRHSWGGIKMLGRSAVWDHSIKLNDVIKDAMESTIRYTSKR